MRNARLHAALRAALRAALLLSIAYLVGTWALGLLDVAHAPPWSRSFAWLLIFAALGLLLFVSKPFERVAPAVYGDASQPSMSPSKGGGFEWQPAGQPVPYVYPGIGIRHGWLDGLKRRASVRVEWRLPQDVTAEAVERALQDACDRVENAHVEAERARRGVLRLRVSVDSTDKRRAQHAAETVVRAMQAALGLTPPSG